MREILFRGKRVDNGEWIRGDLITTPFIRNTTQRNIIYILDVTKADYDCFEDLMEDNGIFEVYPETVCQYTGLTDKNGRKIFEGDILSAHLDDEYPEDITYVQITWNGFSWCMRESMEDDVMTEFDCNTFEVCGNIFDNHELIEK